MPKIRGETTWGERDRLMAGGSWGRETAWVVGGRGILGKRRREIGEKEDLSRSKE